MTDRPALGAFELVEPIGRGGMAEVWRGRHRGSGAPVAIKIVTTEHARAPLRHEALGNEVRAMARLDHPGIVRVHDYGTVTAAAADASAGALSAAAPYLVMELAPGGTLKNLQVSSWSTLREVLSQLLRALAHSHARGVVHRDLKPSNVLVADGGRLQLADFGIAYALSSSGQAQTGHGTAGTAAYMAPEQVLGLQRDEGPATDLYALGCLAFRLACGRPPFLGAEREQVLRAQCLRPAPTVKPRFAVPAQLAAWIDVLLCKQPRDRFRFAADALAALDELVDTGSDRSHAVVSIRARAREPLPERPLDAAPEMLGVGLGVYGLQTIPLTGREPEQRALWDALGAAARSGTPRVVEVRGRAGLGKTRLAQWLVEQAAETGAAHGLFAAFGSPTAGGLVGMIQRWLGTEGLPREDVDERLFHHPIERSLDALAPDDRERLLDLLSPLPGARAAIPPAERFAVLSATLAAVAATCPIVIVLDDATREATAFAEHLLKRRDARLPIVIVLTVRDESLEDQPAEAALLDELSRQAGASRLELAPLTPSAHAELIGAMLGLEGGVAQRLAERTSGNPLFAIQLVGDWVERGELVAGRRGFRMREGASPVLPDGIHALWAGRIERLLERRAAEQADAGVVLELAAILGREVPLDDLRGACGEAGVAVPAGLLDTLAWNGLARVTASHVSFAHALLCESLQRRAREAGRWQRLHAACARTLRAGPESLRREERIGRHLAAADDASGAAPLLLESAREALARCDYDDVGALAQVCDEALERAGASAGDPRRATGFVLRAEAAVLQARLDECAEWLDRAALVDDGEPAVLAKVCQLRARIALKQARNERALELFREGHRRMTETGNVRGAAVCQHGVAEAAKLLARFDESIAYYERAASLFSDAGDDAGAAAVRIGLADVYRRLGRSEEAIPLLERCVETARAAGDRYAWGVGVNVLGDIARADARLEDAERWYAQAMACFEALASDEAGIVGLNLALVQLARRQYVAARARFERERVDLEGEGRAGYLVFCLAGLWACAVAEGAWNEANVYADRVVPLMSELGVVDEDLAAILEEVGRLAAAAGRRGQAHLATELATAQRKALRREG